MVNSGSSADLLIAFALVNERTDLLESGEKVLVLSPGRHRSGAR